MQPVAKYPLEQVLDVKKKRVEDQEKVVQEKRKILENEKQKLREREIERDKAVQHDRDKLEQLREALDEGTTCPKILQMKAYLKVTKERVKVEEKKVRDQKEHVETAKQNLEAAIQELKIKRLEVDKLKTHKKDWIVEMKKEQAIVEGRVQDELGSIIFSARKRNK